MVLFRDPDTNSVVCLDDTCPHRGAPLSKGWVAKEPRSGHTCVVCPYHGWAFDGEGHLTDVPSAEEGKWPKRPLLNTYPVSTATDHMHDCYCLLHLAVFVAA